MKSKKTYPDIYVDKITSISIDYLKRNNIKGIIVDMDNTLINHKVNAKIDGLEDWIKEVKDAGIKIIIVSNSIKRKNVLKVSKEYDLPYVYIALKPLGIGFKIGRKKMNLKKEEVAVVGDQIFTDVLGANLKGMHSILVLPVVKNKESIYTGIARKFEKKVLKKYLETNEVKTKETIDKI